MTSIHDIGAIVQTSQKNNPKFGITGLLFFDGEFFMQCLEGSKENVNTLYHHIARDQRHQNLMILSYQSIEHREFSHWAMGYVPLVKNIRTIIKVIIKNELMSNRLNPYLLDESTILYLFQQFAVYKRLIEKKTASNHAYATRHESPLTFMSRQLS
jgi:hypothetical protein